MTNNKLDIIKKAQTVTLPSTTTTCRSNSKLSFGVVNSKTNGKRLSFSKALVTKLELKDAAYITPIKEDSVIIVAGAQLFESYKCDLRGNDKKAWENYKKELEAEKKNEDFFKQFKIGNGETIVV